MTETSVLISNVLLLLHGYIGLTENSLFSGFKAERFHAQGIQVEVNALFVHSLQQAVSRKTTTKNGDIKMSSILYFNSL